MAKKLYIRLQAPCVELPITVTGITGDSVQSKVGLRYYTSVEAQKKLEELRTIEFGEEFQSLVQELDEINAKREELSENSEKAVEVSNAVKELDKKFIALREKTAEKVEKIIKENIVYLKDIPLDVYDEVDGKPQLIETYMVKDTRTEKENEFWKDEKECLATCIEQMFVSKPWKDNVLELFQKTLLGTEVNPLGN